MKTAQKIVIMGVSGCGKSSVGAALAEKLGATYVDGDDLHPPENIAKMRAGQPLDDDDRWPWLAHVGKTLEARQGTAIIGCSALKRSYRDTIRAAVSEPVLFVHLAGSREVIAARMGKRSGHFMPGSLLESQFAALEPPQDDELALTVSIEQSLDDIISTILSAWTEARS
ncbi:gluconokinase [Agrobacterium vitis]|nr:gluconokinase [Agrobacterium vitis]MBE1437956.1 gluconokinase [Agrobacterium vitis]